MADPLNSELEREQRRAEELAYLSQLALDMMSRSTALPIVTCEIAIDSILALLNCQQAAILLRSESSQESSYSLEITSERGGAEWVTPSLYEPFISGRRALALKGKDGASYLGVLLTEDADWIGIMLARREPESQRFGDDEIQMITLLAGVTTTTLLNNRLSRSLSDRLALLQTVMDSSPGGLAVIEIASRKLLMANPAALHMLHLDANALGQPLRIEGRDGALIERLMETLPPSPTITFNFRLTTGTRTRYLQFQVAAVSSDKLLAQINDTTLLHEVEARREAAVASVSHDLKTPLAVLNLGLSNLLTYYEQTPDAERRALIEEALAQIEGMKGAIGGLLSRAQPGKPGEHHDEPGQAQGIIDDPAFFITQVVSELASFARSRGVRVSWLASGEPGVRLRISPTDLQTVARNLLTNAIKYTPSAGSVNIETAVSDDKQWFALIIRDTGVGIPSDELDAIFERGYRARTGSSAEGNGLGLSFVQEIVTRLEGTVQVESEINVGSVFTVILPTVR